MACDDGHLSAPPRRCAARPQQQPAEISVYRAGCLRPAPSVLLFPNRLSGFDRSRNFYAGRSSSRSTTNLGPATTASLSSSRPASDLRVGRKHRLTYYDSAARVLSDRLFLH